jgi:hypothetical protein
VISPRIRAALLGHFPQNLVDQLLECFEEQRRNLLLGKLRPNEVEGGRFAEAAFRMLEHAAGVTAIGTQLNTDNLIRQLATLPAGSAHESVRLHIPRTLRVIYDIRNKRDAAHLADGIDPNLQDATLVSASADWVLAEFVRLGGGVRPDEAFRLVKAITVQRIPAVEDVQGFLKTLRPSLGPGDRILLLLSKRADCGATKEELEKWIRPSQRKNLLRTLHQLEHDKDLIVPVNGRYQITRRGIQEAERKKLLEVDRSGVI